MMRRVEVHRCPAVPTDPKTTAGITKSILAVSSIIIALLPPSSSIVFPNLSETVELTCRPMAVEPVNETNGIRLSVSIFSPTIEPRPIIVEKIPEYPFFSITSLHIF